MATAKRNAKDTVFRDFFCQPQTLLELYRSFHPKDTDVTADMIHDVTIQNVLTDRIYNDLDFIVRDRLMILVEVQSTWSVNIIVRAFMYLAQSYQDRFERLGINLYSETKIDLPEPELYFIYTVDRKEHPKTLSLSKEFFNGKQTALNVKIKMLYGDDKKSIVGQYVRFCKVLNEQKKLYGSTAQTIAETIRICKNENVLKDYLTSHEQEAVNIMMALFNDDYIQKAYGLECEQRGRKAGLEEGRAKGMQQGQDATLLLMQKLFAAGRMEDAQRITTDKVFFHQIMKEFAV